MKEILESANKVYNALGKGYSECVYQKALAAALRAHPKGFIVESEVTIPVFYEGLDAGAVRADLIVTDKTNHQRVIIELKTVSRLSSKHLAQLRNYLVLSSGSGRSGGFHLRGLLINFPPTDEAVSDLLKNNKHSGDATSGDAFSGSSSISLSLSLSEFSTSFSVECVEITVY